MAEVMAGVGTLTTLVGEIFTMITSNPYLVLMLAAGLIGVGIGVFRKVKGASKG